MNLGVLAAGDSLAVGYGPDLGGVPSQSWGLWLAKALGELPYTFVASGGAVVADVPAQLARVANRHYDLAVLSVGTNDALRGVPAENFARDAAVAIERLCSLADHVAVADLRPVIGRRNLSTASYADGLRAAVAQHGAVLVPAVEESDGHLLVAPDLVHLTALGQLQLADDAAARLTGLTFAAAPSALTRGSRQPSRPERVAHRLRRLAVR